MPTERHILWSRWRAQYKQVKTLVANTLEGGRTASQTGPNVTQTWPNFVLATKTHNMTPVN